MFSENTGFVQKKRRQGNVPSSIHISLNIIIKQDGLNDVDVQKIEAKSLRFSADFVKNFKFFLVLFLTAGLKLLFQKCTILFILYDVLLEIVLLFRKLEW